MMRTSLCAVAMLLISQSWGIAATEVRCDSMIDEAKALDEAGKKEEAKAKLAAAIETCTPPNSDQETKRLSVAHNRYGALIYQEQAQEAIEHFRMARKLDPENLSAAANLGGVMIQMKRYTEAVPILEAAVSKGTDDQDLMFRLEYNAGLAQTNLCARKSTDCDPLRGEKHFQHAAELKPDFADIWFQLAAFMNDIHGDSRKAMELFHKACDLGHKDGCFQYEHFKSQLDK